MKTLLLDLMEKVCDDDVATDTETHKVCVFFLRVKLKGWNLEIGMWVMVVNGDGGVFCVKEKTKGKKNEGSLYLLFFCLCVPLTLLCCVFLHKLYNTHSPSKYK